MKIIDHNGVTAGVILIMVALISFIGILAVISGSSIIRTITLYVLASIVIIFCIVIMRYGLILLRQSISKV